MSTEQGVGRFVTASKSIMMLHDIELGSLVYGRDKDRFKAICRSEPVVAKVHFTTNVVPYVHLVATSNQHLLQHEFIDKNPLTGTESKTIYRCDAIPDRKKEQINQQDLLAVKRRFLEVRLGAMTCFF
jgi:hypothetical protein